MTEQKSNMEKALGVKIARTMKWIADQLGYFFVGLLFVGLAFAVFVVIGWTGWIIYTQYYKEAQLTVWGTFVMLMCWWLGRAILRDKDHG